MEAIEHQHTINFCRVFYLGPGMGKDHKNLIQTSNVAISLVQKSAPLLYFLFKMCWPFLRQVNCSMFWGFNQPQSLLKSARNSITGSTERSEEPAQISGPWGSHKPIWEAEDSGTAQCQRALLTCTQYYWSTSYFPPCTRSMKSLLCQAPNLSKWSAHHLCSQTALRPSEDSY